MIDDEMRVKELLITISRECESKGIYDGHTLLNELHKRGLITKDEKTQLEYFFIFPGER